MDKERRLIVTSSWGCDDVFKHLFDRIYKGVPNDLNEHDTILLEGGADISSLLYGEQPSGYMGGVNKLRDLFEVGLVRKGFQSNCSFIGICRGAQLLTAMLGGSLLQHVSGHCDGDHDIITDKGEILPATSVHHQMMYPFDLRKDEYKILAFAWPNQSNCYIRENSVNIIDDLPKLFVEPEVVWFPKIRGLAIQGHPEYVTPGVRFHQYCVDLAKELIVNE